jgi:hypothetical protein
MLQEEAEEAKLRQTQFPSMPSSLGLDIKEKNPNTKRLDMEESSDLPVGAIYSFLDCGVFGKPNLTTSYITVRANTPFRWIRLIVTRYKEESLEETVQTYLKTLDPSLFDGKTPYFI